MLCDELSTVAIEAMCYEDGDIVHPRIGRRSGEKDPLIGFSDLVERLYPWSSTDYLLLIKNEECVFNIDILLDVVPAVDGD